MEQSPRQAGIQRPCPVFGLGLKENETNGFYKRIIEIVCFQSYVCDNKLEAVYLSEVSFLISRFQEYRAIGGEIDDER